MTDLAQLPIRRLTADDLRACQELAEDRDWGRETGKWRFLLATSEVFGIDDPHAAGQLAAAVALTRYSPVAGGDTDGTGDSTGRVADGHGFGSIGMLLVASRYNRRGLGSRLLRHVMERAHPAPVRLYSTTDGRPLYDRFGFRPVSGVVAFKGDGYVPDPDVPRDGIHAVTEADLHEIRTRDQEIFGADRGALLTHLMTFAERFLVARHGSAVAGYAATWRNEGRLFVGPLVADDDLTARALVDALFRDADGPTRIDLTDDASHLRDWVLARGLRLHTGFPLLIHGTSDRPGMPRRIYCPLSQAVG